jgi:CMP-N,N'-diacetyllegionaminic acid synthase
MIVAVIPARGGSKQVPRKNVRPLAGVPLVAHTIGHARQAASIGRVIVSTDDEEIASASRAAGADVIDRPKELASDTASSESVLVHALSRLDPAPELVVLLQCTSPVRKKDDIERAVETLNREGADSLLSVCRSHFFLWRKTERGAEAVNYDPAHRKRRQDLAPEFVENGSIYIFKPWVLDRHQSRLGGTIALFEMDYWSSFQIDSEEDFELCEWILRRRGSG